jgi:predicted Zn-dependent peptidase
MEHLDAATLAEFQAFNKKFYVPNNAVLVVAGNFEKAQTIEWIKKYYGDIPKGAPVNKQQFPEEPITQTIMASYEDPNIQIPMLLTAYRTPSMKTREAHVLEMISGLLSDGKSSRLYKKLVDEKKMALQIGAFSFSQEDHGMYVVYGLPLAPFTIKDLQTEFDAEIALLQNELISEKELEKLKNKIENQYVNNNASVEGIAESLATYYLLFGNVNLINTDIETYRSVTREEIQAVAKKYLGNNQRLLLEYLPTQEKSKN